MGKKKTHTSLFSTLTEQFQSNKTLASAAEIHIVDNECFAAFQSLEDIRQFHSKLLEHQPSSQNDEGADGFSEPDNNEMDMKSFAQQFLIDLPKEKSERMAMGDTTSHSLRRIPSGAVSNELFGADQAINWLPKVKGNNIQSPDAKKRKSTQICSTPSKLASELSTSSKRSRRHIREMPQSSGFIFMSDNDISDDGENTNHSSSNSTNIFTCLQEHSCFSTPEKRRSNRIAFEDMSSILLTLDVANKKKTKRTVPNELSVSSMNDTDEPTISLELAEPSIIKSEPIEQLVISHVVEAKEEPVEINITATGLMGFGTSEYSGGLDNYVQNIHLIHSSPPSVHASNPSVVITPVPDPSTRPKRIRKRKKLFDETEPVIKQKRMKLITRRKRLSVPAPATLDNRIDSMLFTDAEIEQQFGERLPVVKSEQDEETDLQSHSQQQQTANSRVVIEIQPMSGSIQRPPTPVPQTPMEKARAKLTTALGRGQGPDTFLLKIRSRESKMVEVQLAIYGTADWHSHRVTILAKIEEALRGLRVSWTKIDIRVDEFDVQICTSPQAASVTPSSMMASNSSWFLKTLSEAGPLIVHVHDRRYPQQRNLFKCPCPQCSPNVITPVEPPIDSSLPVIVSVAPVTLPTENRRLSAPTILSRSHQSHASFDTTISSIHTIDTVFFKGLVRQWGTNTVSSVVQCVLDLALIVSVHATLPNLRVPTVFPQDEYRRKYQQIIDPLKYTNAGDQQPSLTLPKPTTIARIISKNGAAQPVLVSKPQDISLLEPDILTFYRTLKQNKVNIRSAKAMRNVISSSFSRPKPTTSNVIKATPITTLILPKQTSSLCLPSTNTQPSMTLVGLKSSSTESSSIAPTTTNHSRRSRRRTLPLSRFGKRGRVQIRTNVNSNSSGTKQQAHFTPIIELKPIMGGPTVATSSVLSSSRGENGETDDESVTILESSTNGLKKVTKIISASTIQNEQQQQQQRIRTITTTGAISSQLTNGTRVIRLSIAKPPLKTAQQQSILISPPPTIRLVSTPTPSNTTVLVSPKIEPISLPILSNGKNETVPLVPKQINIIKSFSSSSSSLTPAIKLSNPVLISNKSQQQPPSTK